MVSMKTDTPGIRNSSVGLGSIGVRTTILGNLDRHAVAACNLHHYVGNSARPDFPAVISDRSLTGPLDSETQKFRFSRWARIINYATAIIGDANPIELRLHPLAVTSLESHHVVRRFAYEGFRKL